tara:strand:- start:124 stop:435 length:312 start_codon:yes stop_codon:yes gene_type:complete
VLKVSEVYEKQTKEFKERPDGTEYAHFSTRFDSRDVLINKEYIVSVQPYEFTSSADAEKIENAFPSDTKFSLLVMDGNSFRKSEVIVVGSFEKFCRLLQENKS